MKKLLLLLCLFLLLQANSIFSQSGTFDFETATYVGDGSVAQTVSGVIINVVDEAYDTRIDDCSGYAGMSGIAAYACKGDPPPTWMTVTFSQPVDVTTLRAAEVNFTLTTNWVFTPNTGTPKTISIDGENGTTATLDFAGITSIVITRQDEGHLNFVIDDVVFEASLPVGLSSFTARAEGQAIVLNWSTATETDNLGFILERTAGNGVWQPVASYKTNAALKGQGNSSTTTNYTFTDNTVSAGKEYRYRLGDVNVAGIITMHSPIVVIMAALPQNTELFNAYPNPFNPQTTINYTLQKDAQVTITVYDLLGRLVKTLVDENQTAGSYDVTWNGSDAIGNKAASGAYLVRMQTAEVTQIQKVLLLK
ncbi:MAG TPA: FlgD immunoglobulin-like domain containing protein [bacterium]|nr:FlgD immunoglobulin-like domain containing protein [bacterium]HPN44691.1 FlgD immunoglobulin-like domain containing protein [bacterium]